MVQWTLTLRRLVAKSSSRQTHEGRGSTVYLFPPRAHSTIDIPTRRRPGMERGHIF